MQNKENKITYTTLLTKTTVSILKYFPVFIQQTEFSLGFVFFNMVEIIVHTTNHS